MSARAPAAGDSSDDGWSDDEPCTPEWHDVLLLPRGCGSVEGACPSADPQSPKVVSAVTAAYRVPRFSNGSHRYQVIFDAKLQKWRVFPLCPCGVDVRECPAHVSPGGLRVSGCFFGTESGKLLLEDFRRLDVCNVGVAEEWWKQRLTDKHRSFVHKNVLYCQQRFSWTDVLRGPYTMPDWAWEGAILSRLKDHFRGEHDNRVAKYDVKPQDDGTFTVKQQCSCGKTECDNCVFPSTVLLRKSFRDFKLKLRERPERDLEREFRALDCMPPQDAVRWWQKQPIDWQVAWEDGAIAFKMRCKCRKFLLVVPCAKCECLKPCSSEPVDGNNAVGPYSVTTRMESCKNPACDIMVEPSRQKKCKGLCKNCHHKQVIDCPSCKKRVPRGHPCAALKSLVYQSHRRLERRAYPFSVREKGSKWVKCPDCQKVMRKNSYSKHQYMMHCGRCPVEPDAMYSRMTTLYECGKCGFKTFKGKDVATRHGWTHILGNQFPCRDPSCSLVFRQSSQESEHALHAHGLKNKVGERTSKRRRLGDMVTLPSRSVPVPV